MKKEYLALALVIVCVIGVFVGLVKSYEARDKQQKLTTDSNKNFATILGSGKKIAIIRLNGVISEDESDNSLFLSGSPATRARKYLYKAAKDNTVKAVVLRINSPGGTVGASQEVFQAVLECRKKKPVVVTMGDVAASGGYYIASAGDVIISNPGTLTGSIGVIFNAMNFNDLMGKWGIKNNVIKSGKFKDIGSAMRPMTEPERQLLQGIINGTYEQFISAIIKGRIDTPINDSKNSKHILTEQTLRSIADGRILSGEQALKVALVDKLGSLEDAKKEAVKLAQERFKNISDDITIEVYDKPQTFSDFMIELENTIKPESSIENKLPFSLSHPNQPLWIME